MITQQEFNELERRGIYYFKKLQEKLDDNDYWTILRALWIEDGKCDDNWAELFFNSGRGREHKIMKSSDRQALKRLPKQVKVYRVCRDKADEEKWNWTTSREFAERFKKLGEEYIAEKTIDKSEIFAYFNSRREFEVILKKNY